MTQADKLAQALERIKQCVVGDKHPNWGTDSAIYAMRGIIADHCDRALAAYRAQADKQGEAVEKLEELAHRIAWRYKKSSDPHHSDTYTFNRDTLIQFARAIEAAHGIAAPTKEPTNG